MAWLWLWECRQGAWLGEARGTYLVLNHGNATPVVVCKDVVQESLQHEHVEKHQSIREVDAYCIESTPAVKSCHANVR